MAEAQDLLEEQAGVNKYLNFIGMEKRKDKKQ